MPGPGALDREQALDLAVGLFPSWGCGATATENPVLFLSALERCQELPVCGRGRAFSPASPRGCR